MIEFDMPQYVEDPGPDGFGPAFAKLTGKQRKFVVALFQFGVAGDRHNTDAARAAGYGGTDSSIRVTAHKLAHNPKIKEALAEMAKSKLDSAKPMLVDQLLHLAQNAEKEGDRLKATLAIMDRTGMNAVSEHHVVTQDKSVTKEALMAELQNLLKRNPGFQLPEKFQRLLPPPPPKDESMEIIGEFVEVPAEEFLDL